MECFANANNTLEKNQKNYAEAMKREVKESYLGMSGIIKKHKDQLKKSFK